ncbi:hypothetical protein [Nocardioides dilutus]
MARGARRRPQPERRQLALAEFRLGTRLAREDLTALAESLDNSPPWFDGEASTEWKRAAGLYGAARAALREVTTLADVMAVHTTLCQARFHLARAEAICYGEPPPTSSEPCWFDPRHGPASAEVEWPGAGTVRACPDDVQRIEAGLAPRRRLLRLTELSDPDDTSSLQRRMALHARGAGGYALGALYAGTPHAPTI